MKKLTIFVIGCLVALLLCGCAAETPAVPADTNAPEPTAAPTEAPFSAAEAEIIESSHPREEAYKSPFKTRMIDAPLVAVHLEAGDNYSDEALRALTEKVVSDIQTISGFTGEAPRKITVYAVNRLLRDRALLLGDHLICTVGDMESGAYREALIGACYDIPIPWIQVGLVENVFGSPSESGLQEYYSDEAHALAASCAAVYFIDGVADEETVQAARQTAASIVSFVLETRGFGALREMTSTEDALPAWAERLGIEAPVLPEGSARAAVMTAYKDVSPGWVCVLQFDNITMNVKQGAFAQTPDELYEFACRFFIGADVVLAQIKEESPTLSEYAQERFRLPIVINIEEDKTNSSLSTAWGETIDLRYQVAAWHELVHVLLWNEPLLWLHEAAAERFSYRAMSVALQVPYDEAEELEFLSSPELSDEERNFFTLSYNIYLAERGSYVPTDVIDYQAIRRSYAVSSLLLGYDPAGGRNSLAGVMGRKYDEKKTDPYALSYYEAELMLDYLTDTYGAENVLPILITNEPLEEVCGKAYPELYQDLLAKLREEYGELISDPE